MIIINNIITNIINLLLFFNMITNMIYFNIINEQMLIDNLYDLNNIKITTKLYFDINKIFKNMLILLVFSNIFIWLFIKNKIILKLKIKIVTLYIYITISKRLSKKQKKVFKKEVKMIDLNNYNTTIYYLKDLIYLISDILIG